MSPPQKLNSNIISLNPIRMAEMGFLHDTGNLTVPLTQERIKVFAMVQQGFAKNKGNGYFLTKKGEEVFRGKDYTIKKQNAIDLILTLPEPLIDQFLGEYETYLTDHQRAELAQHDAKEALQQEKTWLRMLDDYLANIGAQIDYDDLRPLFDWGKTDPIIADKIRQKVMKKNGELAYFLREYLAEEYPMIIDHDTNVVR